MSYTETVVWTLLGSALGAGLSVWLAVCVERYRARRRFAHLEELAGSYIACEVQDGRELRVLFIVEMVRHPKLPAVLQITGRSRIRENPGFTGELVFTDSLRSASGSYVHMGNNNMFGFFDVQLIAGEQPSFNVHQRFVKSGQRILRNEIWRKHAGLAWEQVAPEPDGTSLQSGTEEEPLSA